MRSALAFCLMISLSVSAAATAKGPRDKSQHFVVRPNHAVSPAYVTPGGRQIYRDDSVPGGLRTNHDDPPAYDDPSKFGGG
jgi:hypothetical protein